MTTTSHLIQRKESMRLAGLTRVRNEADIITDLLDHMATFCDAVYVYDDESTDNTAEIARKHPIVHKVITGKRIKNRFKAETENRQALLEEAQKYVWDWFIYMDADERIEGFEWNNFDPDYWEAVKFKLYDFYITPDDITQTVDIHTGTPFKTVTNYSEREWIGPEYRNILMMFRNYRWTRFAGIDAREPFMRQGRRCLTSGYVKHYGKALTIERYDRKVKYYIEEFGAQYRTKWLKRVGKAVKNDFMSDFGTKLIKWQDREKLGKPLIRGKSEDQSQDPNQYLYGEELLKAQSNKAILVPNYK